MLYKLLHLDDEIIVVTKEHGVHVINDRYGMSGETLQERLKIDYGNLFIVHRLDAGTGGVMVFARTPQSHKILCSQFENRTVSKNYLAISVNSIADQTLMLPIAMGSGGKHKINFTSGKKAITTFTTIKTNGKYSLINAKPLTGRTHQIRVHLKALKAPLLQDFIYNTKILDKKLSLFANKLSFIHPKSEKIVDIEVEMSNFMKGLEEKFIK